MKIVTLYTGNDVSLSPFFSGGRKVSDYVRLVADDQMAITNGKIFTSCVDVSKSDIYKWSDCDIAKIPNEMPDNV